MHPKTRQLSPNMWPGQTGRSGQRRTTSAATTCGDSIETVSCTGPLRGGASVDVDVGIDRGRYKFLSHYYSIHYVIDTIIVPTMGEGPFWFLTLAIYYPLGLIV